MISNAPSVKTAREVSVSERSYDRLYIGGEWVAPHSARAIPSIDPATEAVWAEVAEGDDTDIDRAVGAAKAAMQGAWRNKITATQRGLLLYKLAELIRRDTRAAGRARDQATTASRCATRRPRCSARSIG